jgi:hypothetical protein
MVHIFEAIFEPVRNSVRICANPKGRKAVKRIRAVLEGSSFNRYSPSVPVWCRPGSTFEPNIGATIYFREKTLMISDKRIR